MPIQAHGSSLVAFRGEPFDAIADLAQGWDMEYYQLDAGPNPSDMTQLRLGGLDVCWERVSRTVQISGRPQLGTVVFALRDTRGASWVFRGRETDADTLALVRPGDELDARLEGGLLSFAADVKVLTRRLGGSELWDGRSQDRMVLAPGQADAIRCLGHKVLRAARCAVEPQDSQHARGDCAAKTLDLLTASLRHVLDARGPARRPGPRPTRITGASKADAFIRANLHRHLTIDDLVQVAGVGERALRSGFSERFGHGPKAHITSLRLHAIRRALRAATPPHTVTRLASRFGTRHFGDFAVRYRRLFGETLSETLSTPRPS